MNCESVEFVDSSRLISYDVLVSAIAEACLLSAMILFLLAIMTLSLFFLFSLFFFFFWPTMLL